jgi:hypothetical protein
MHKGNKVEVILKRMSGKSFQIDELMTFLTGKFAFALLMMYGDIGDSVRCAASSRSKSRRALPLGMGIMFLWLNSTHSGLITQNWNSDIRARTVGDPSWAQRVCLYIFICFI